MQITFDTTTITDDEVRGIFALLDTVRPEALAVEEPTVNFEMGPFSSDELDEYATGEIPVAEDPDDPKHLTVHPIITTDANGLPWDERIHSGTKALNADGTWRTKRGVDKALVAEVEAELRGAGIAEIDAANEKVAEMMGVPDAQVVAPPAPPAPEAPKAPAVAPVETAPSAPVAPSSAVSPFVALMKRVTTAQGAGKLTQPRVKELLESLEKKSIMDLRTDEDALASFAVLLDGEGV